MLLSNLSPVKGYNYNYELWKKIKLHGVRTCKMYVTRARGGQLNCRMFLTIRNFVKSEICIAT